MLKENKEFCKNGNIEKYAPVTDGKRNGRKSDTNRKNFRLTNLEEGNYSTESINCALRVMCFTIHTGFTRTPI